MEQPNSPSRLQYPCCTQHSAHLLCAVALVCLVFLAYAPALNDYLLADSFRIVGQMDFHSALRFFSDTTGFGRNEYRPLVPLTYAVDQFFWGDRPFGYHLTNLALHALSSVLMYFVFLRLAGSPLTAFCSAVLFALQPAHHSRVAWIAARDSGLCLLLLLASWLAYLHSRGQAGEAAADHPSRQPRRRRLLRLAGGLAYLLALLSYEGAIAFPLVLLAMELLVYADDESWPARVKRALRATWPLLVMTAAYLAWWLLLFKASVGEYDLLLTARGILANFYRLHYRLFYHVQHWLGLAYLAAFVWLWRERRHFRPLLGFSIAIIWLGYLPYMHVRGFADRFSMLSVVGAALLLGLCASALSPGWHGSGFSRALPLVLVLLFSGYYAWGTGRRARHWTEAGAQAKKILTDLQQMHPQFPEKAVLILDRIPAMHENAYVFPLGLRAAIRRRLKQELPEIYYSTGDAAPELSEQLMARGPLFRFRYLAEQQRLVQVSAPVATPVSAAR